MRGGVGGSLGWLRGATAAASTPLVPAVTAPAVRAVGGNRPDGTLGRLYATRWNIGAVDRRPWGRGERGAVGGRGGGGGVGGGGGEGGLGGGGRWGGG